MQHCVCENNNFDRAASTQVVSVMTEMFVRPSVCPSVKRVNSDKTKKTSAKILTPYKTSPPLQRGLDIFRRL